MSTRDTMSAWGAAPGSSQRVRRGAWSADGTSLVLEIQTLGNDHVARVTHVFQDKSP